MLRRVALAKIDHPEALWKELTDLPAVAAEQVPEAAVKALGELLPEGSLLVRYARRPAGLGSLGRPRFIALAEWKGGRIAREAKAVAQSSFAWAYRRETETRDLYREVLDKAVRCPDPWVRVKRRWIVRRLAPDCSRIELADLPKENELASFLYTAGWEAANIHLGSASAAALLIDLVSLGEGWLHEAVETLKAAVLADWEAWKGPSGEKPKNKPGGRKKTSAHRDGK